MRQIRSEFCAAPKAEVLAVGLGSRSGFFWLDDAPTGRALLGWGPRAVVRSGPDWVAQARALLRPAPPPPGVPFAGGLVGWVGYEAGADFERMPPRPDLDPGWRLHLARYDGAVLSTPDPGRWQVVGDPAWVEEALAALRDLPAQAPPPAPPRGVLVDDGDPAGFLRGVQATLEHIAAGDCYVLNLARRLRVAGVGAPLDAYRRLRALRPARFGACLNAGDRWLLSSSPELFLSLAGGVVQSGPIKGTRPLGDDAAATQAELRALEADPKERAELTMIVDLVRNDLGRVCAPGTVHAGPRQVIPLPGLVHAWQPVSGQLRPGLDVLDLLAATFPPGSVTGAPKVQVMALIHRLEPHPRGPYTGALGYLADGGGAQLAVAIRVAAFAQGEALVHVGCGVVADSEPQRELAESALKAQGLLAALVREG